LGRRVYTFTVMIQTRKSQQFPSVLRPNYAIISSVSEPFKRRRLCSRIRIFLFSDFKKRDFLLFFWNDVSKSHKKSLASFVLNPSKWVHILRGVITVIHFIYLFVSLVHLRTFITFTTHSSKLHSFLWMWSPHFWAKMFDVGDLPVLTFGNCVLKTRVIKWPLKLYGRFFTFSAFFSKSQNMTFYVFFELSRTFSRTLVVVAAWFQLARSRHVARGQVTWRSRDRGCVLRHAGTRRWHQWYLQRR